MYSSRLSAQDPNGHLPAGAGVLLAAPFTPGTVSRFRRTRAEGASERSEAAVTAVAGLIAEMDQAPDSVLVAYGAMSTVALGHALSALREEVAAWSYYVQHLSDMDSGSARLLAMRFAETIGTKLAQVQLLAEQIEVHTYETVPGVHEPFATAVDAQLERIREEVVAMPALRGEARGLLEQPARTARLDEVVERARQAAELSPDERALEDLPRA
jgi:hypothetical protein